MIIKLKDILNEVNGTAYPYSSTQVNLPDPYPFIDFASSIPEEEVYNVKGYGREDEPHITVLYGLLTVDPQDIAKVLKTIDFPISCILGKTSLFENHPNYDVLKVDVNSPSLRKLNSILDQQLENENKYPSYIPHLTVSYLKRGIGKKYAGDNRFEGKEYLFDKIKFSQKGGSERRRYLIKLK